jgi:hypothetical protein
LCCGLIVLSAGACGTCGSSSAPSSSTAHCVEARLCLTITGPLAGATTVLVLEPDCIVGQGLDAVFTTRLSGQETNIEIDVQDPALGRNDYRAGTYPVGKHTNAQAGASVWVTPDKDVPGYRGGWYTDAAGSSGTVTLSSNPGGSVNGVVAVPKHGTGSALTIRGTFRCR